MALAKTINTGPPLNQRGQGAVEAILALPVFLALVCIIFQLFFLGMAQIQLQYAAFYAARVGAVNASDEKEMRRTVKRILARSPGLVSLPDRSYEVEILDTEENSGAGLKTTQNPAINVLKVRVHWHYPLTVPLADKFLRKSSTFGVLKRPSVHLKASWAMTMFGSISGDQNNAPSPQS